MILNGTKPGSKFDSQNFEVIFVKGHQVGIGCYLVEYEMNWTNLMNIILSTFENVSNDSKEISKALTDVIEARIDQRFLATGASNITVEIEILDQDYFPLKQTKSLQVTFDDMFKTSLIFFIRRKQVMKSLRVASLQKVSEIIPNRASFQSLEIPVTLKSDLLKESKNIWYEKQNFTRACPTLSSRMMFRRDHSWRAMQFLMI